MSSPVLQREQLIVDISHTYGAILIGGLIAFGLSGILSVQAVLYYMLYPHDKPKRKGMVATVWCLDLLHSSFIAASLVFYFIANYGNDQTIDQIPWSIALSVVVTACQTLIAHCFWAMRIYRASARSRLFTGPILVLASARLLSACVTTGAMIHVKKFSTFKQQYRWVFTTGLALSVGVDILITSCLWHFLREIRKRIDSSEPMLIKAVNTLTIYTLENGLLTCLATSSSMICWLAMSGNLIFLGLHFVIGKLYANSLLASLNTGKQLGELQGPRPRYDASQSGTRTYVFQPYRDPIDTLLSQTGMGSGFPIRRVYPKAQVNVFQTKETRKSADSDNHYPPQLVADVQDIGTTAQILDLSPQVPGTGHVTT